MSPESRRKHARGFLTKGLEKKPPTRDEFTAYGQACLEMARGTFQLLRDHGAILFASAIPAVVRKPDQPYIEEFLRKDHVVLQERLFYFLEADMTYPVQAADLCIDCLNWGFRLPSQGMNATRRDEIGDEFGPWLNQLQFSGAGQKDGRVFPCWGIVCVQNPYAPGRT